MPRRSMYIRAGKRVLDLAVASVAIVLLAVPMLLVALLVWWDLGFPLLFRQERAGLAGKPFTIVKFRTMRDPRPGQRLLGTDAERLTRTGLLLRNTSLDELPELLNVLKGEMSLVCPRPLLVEYLPRYGPEQRRRHDVKPGVTGLAQVHGRNTLTWEEKFALDIRYVDHVSLMLDLQILWQSLGMVLKRIGVSQPGHATSEEFLGDGHGQ